MANSLRIYNPIFYAQEGLITLEKVLGLAGVVHRGYDKAPQQKGDTIKIKGPGTFTAQSMPIASDQDLDTRSVTVTVDQWYGVRFGLTDKELSETQQAVVDDHIRPATVAVADKIDQTLAGLFKFIANENTATDPAAIADLTGLRESMFDLKVPLRPRYLMVDGGYENDLLKLSAFNQVNTAADGVSAQREGMLGRKFGFDIFANQNTPTRTAGSAGSITATSADASAGDTTISMDDGSGSATGSFTAGDIIIISGETQQYVVAADSADGASVSITPALENDVADATGVTLVQNDAAALNAAFHRNAFALAMAPLSDLGNNAGARIGVASDPITNLALRSRLWYDGDTATVSVGIDALWGVKVLDPDLGVRLAQ